VGNTIIMGVMPDQISVHPHGRGEHIAFAVSWESISGSSPRAWGTLPFLLPGQISGRFIPTGVGNTSKEKKACHPSPVHPHGRGEHSGRTACSILKTGSSPRAWGTQTVESTQIWRQRFIPTGVGNTAGRISSKSPTAVHPHGRGEHVTTS